MPNSNLPTDLLDHLEYILSPIKAYAELLQKSEEDYASVAGHVLYSLCRDAGHRMEKLSDGLEDQFGSLTILDSLRTEVMQGDCHDRQ